MRRVLILLFLFTAGGWAQELPAFPATNPPTFGIHGLVTSESGEPVAGALVELGIRTPQRRAKGAEEPERVQVVTATTTDTEGRFVLLGIPMPLPVVTIRVRSDEYEGTERELRPERGLVRVEVAIRLSPLDQKLYAQTPRAVQAIFYCTDRKPTGSPKPKKFYGPDRGSSVTCGAAEAEVPTTSLAVKVNVSVGKQVVSKAIFAPDSKLTKVEPLSEAEFLKRFQVQAQKGEAMVFIHGYNNSFEDATRRLAELAYHLKLSGPVVLYSWPSQASWYKYVKDETNIAWTELHYQGVLKMITEKGGAKAVHLLAHSMGNRALVEALRAFAGASPRFAQVVMAAPDVDRATFMQKAPEAQKAAARISLYGSSHDQPIKLSKLFHGYPRAGDGGRDIAVVSGLDSVDASAARTDILGHDYFTDPRAVLRDIELVLQGKVPPPRPRLVREQHPDGAVWMYRP